MTEPLVDLCEKEGWQTYKVDKEIRVKAFGQDFPLALPFTIYCKLYREEVNPALKYKYFRRMHEIAWPKELLHTWTEERLKAHCDRWRCVTYAGGASCAKSRDAAKIAILFWLSDPTKNAVIIASTTLSSLNARIGGYVITLLSEMSIKLPFTYMRSQPPRILYNRDDAQHGIFFVSAKQGDDDAAIKDLIGRHPKLRMLVLLDEATDMPIQLLGAIPNCWW